MKIDKIKSFFKSVWLELKSLFRRETPSEMLRSVMAVIESKRQASKIVIKKPFLYMEIDLQPKIQQAKLEKVDQATRVNPEDLKKRGFNYLNPADDSWET